MYVALAVRLTRSITADDRLEPALKKIPAVADHIQLVQTFERDVQVGNDPDGSTAASFARKHDLAERHAVNLEGALTLPFEFEGQPYSAGFPLATNGIVLPVFNVFRMFSKMGSERIAATSDGAVDLDTIVKEGVRGRPDLAALAARDAGRVTVLARHYHDDDLPDPSAEVSLTRWRRRASSPTCQIPRALR